MGKINQYTTISQCPIFIYGVLIPHLSSLILPVDAGATAPIAPRSIPTSYRLIAKVSGIVARLNL
jgi:hypothetical protein